jgi:proliferating cell nuclear antigen
MLEASGVDQARTLYEEKLSKKEFDAYVKLDAKLIQDALRDAKLVSENVKFKASEEGFTIEAKGTLGEYKTIIKRDDPAMLEFELKQPAEASYSLDLLTDIVKSAKQEIIFEFSTNAPIRITYNVDVALLVFFVAPRVEE